MIALPGWTSTLRLMRIVRVRGAVIIAKGNQRANFKRTGTAAQVAYKVILNDDGVFAVNQEDSFLELDVAAAILEDRKWIQPERFQVLESSRMSHVFILIGARVRSAAPPSTRVSSSFDRSTTRPTGGLVAAVSSA